MVVDWLTGIGTMSLSLLITVASDYCSMVFELEMNLIWLEFMTSWILTSLLCSWEV
jgi:hypothetical protein